MDAIIPISSYYASPNKLNYLYPYHDPMITNDIANTTNINSGCIYYSGCWHNLK